MKPLTIQRYGWIPQHPDIRDHQYAAKATVLPPATDMRGLMPPVYDQGQLGSCTANAIAAALQFNELKDAMSDQAIPARLWIYYKERAIEGTVSQDAGAMIRDGAKAVATIGWPDESQWPYDISTFTQPPANIVPIQKAIEYLAIDQTEVAVKTCLAEGFPVVFGFTVYDSFESSEVARTGVVPMPGATESVLGGHAVMAVGYDDTTRRVIVRNSWGDSWGDAGYFHMPYEYIFNPDLASDFWSFRRIS